MTISNANQTLAAVNRWKYTSTGGETSLSGLDDNGNTLSYQLGTEQLHLNGILLVRGVDYVATTGSSITGLIALIAGDVIDIVSTVSTVISGMVPLSTVTTQGDLIVATGAGAVTRLGVGSSGQILTSNGTTPAYTSTVTGTLNNGTLTGTLTAASSAGTSGQLLSSTGTGVQWVAAPSAGAGNMVQITTGSLSGTSLSLTGLSTYTELFLVLNNANVASSASIQPCLTINSDTTALYNMYGTYWYFSSSYSQGNMVASIANTGQSNWMSQFQYRTYSAYTPIFVYKLTNCKNPGFTDIDIRYNGYNGGAGSGLAEIYRGIYTGSSTVSSLQFFDTSRQTFSTGTYTLWGA